MKSKKLKAMLVNYSQLLPGDTIMGYYDVPDHEFEAPYLGHFTWEDITPYICKVSENGFFITVNPPQCSVQEPKFVSYTMDKGFKYIVVRRV
ncbi:MAG TPA: hypothetical protein VKR58_06365 [Aquella sp.]|nr:hypothetical protein [Aquella sp.]